MQQQCAFESLRASALLHSLKTDVVMRSILAAAGISILVTAHSTQAQVPPYPAVFQTQEIATNAATIHVRVGGSGPPVVLLHGYGETGDMWAPMGADLMRDHTVIVPDLRGLGLSSKPPGAAEPVAALLVVQPLPKLDDAATLPD